MLDKDDYMIIFACIFVILLFTVLGTISLNIISKVIGKNAELDMLPPQEGDVNRTFSKIEKAKTHLNYQPKTALVKGLEVFNDWYKK